MSPKRRSKSHKSRKSHKTHKKDKKHHKSSKRDSTSPELDRGRDYEKSDCYDSTGFKRGTLKENAIFGYTDDNNPFMDQSLSKQYVWAKNKKQVKNPMNSNDIIEELDNVQRRQKEHDRQREERLLEQEMMQRAKEAQTYLGRKSDSHFDIEQAKNRSKIRIEENRAKPIDLLIQYVNEEDENVDVIIHEPTELLIGRAREDLEDLLVDIDAYSRNMEPGKNTQYWEDVRLVVENELKKFDNTGGRTENVTASCVEDMKKLLLDGTLEDAVSMLESARTVLETGDSRHIDVSYYEYFCKLASVMIAERRLKERHARNLRTKLNKLKQEQGISIEPLFPSAVSTEKKIVVKEEDSRETYDHGSYSPKLLCAEDVADEALDFVIYEAEDDFKKLKFLREKFLESGKHDINKDDELLKRVREGEEKGDEDLAGAQVAVEDQSFLWSDKYRPRKPRFLNRVNTGFDWNKYNQTHYDIDNPPPKIVQGYKFNVLYPDLIDRTKTPVFELTPCTDDDNYAVITFKAGPPYEDIAFKIVNREWETSERHGYKCQFYRDMLQLHFHFKRYRYRK